ncbi:MAG TPA: PilT/PilU family type 4a pilus ATPase [Candidatus Competibacteraceae bacterium]|nr:PilT/PilU family type 4a pilus ATPase [Candidatus Competibacteraceae bacterium]
MEHEQAAQYMLSLVRLLLQKGGSDLFITAGSPPAMSLNGNLVRIGEQRLSRLQSERLAQTVMNDRQWVEFEHRQELNFALHYPDMARFRVNVFRQRGSVGMVMRLIPSTIPSFEELNLPPVLAELAMSKRGLVIFLGGTGCGKSTSLAAMVDYRNRNSAEHIVTIEDPIEYFHAHKRCLVTQREIGADTESYAVALKNALRQRPNVILIGEIRDRETMEHAINFAETGHLCLTTLHANSADQAFDRIINFFPPEKRAQVLMDLSFNVRAFLCQRLLPRADRPGQIPAVEVLLNTPFMAKLIFQGRMNEIKAYMAKESEPGMKTFDQALFELYEAGYIDFPTALRHADSQNDIRIRVKLQSKRPLPEELLTDLSGARVESPEHGGIDLTISNR